MMQSLRTITMENDLKNDNQMLLSLLDDSLQDHIYDPPLWSAGPYLKMVDEDCINCYSPVSDPLLRENFTHDMFCDEYNSVAKEFDFNVDVESTEPLANHEPARLSKKKVYLLTSFLSISAVILFGMVFL